MDSKSSNEFPSATGSPRTKWHQIGSLNPNKHWHIPGTHFHWGQGTMAPHFHHTHVIYSRISTILCGHGNQQHFHIWIWRGLKNHLLHGQLQLPLNQDAFPQPCWFCTKLPLLHWHQSLIVFPPNKSVFAWMQYSLHVLNIWVNIHVIIYLFLFTFIAKYTCTYKTAI